MRLSKRERERDSQTEKTAVSCCTFVAKSSTHSIKTIA